MAEYNLAVIAGDGVGPEVIAEGKKVLEAVAAGATSVIQPGGSIRDAEVIAAADEQGIAMAFTGTRVFRH